MSGKKKNRNQDEKTLKTIILITAILNLIKAIADIVRKLLE